VIRIERERERERELAYENRRKSELRLPSVERSIDDILYRSFLVDNSRSCRLAFLS
jgi:hypothetical protein